MKRFFSFRTLILAITASLCFTQAPLKAEGLISDMIDWGKIHLNAAWNVEDLESRAGARNTLFLIAALGGIYYLANKYQHDNDSSARTQKICGYAKKSIKYGAVPLSIILGIYNMANNLGWGPAETLSAIGGIASFLWALSPILGSFWKACAPQRTLPDQFFPPFDSMSPPADATNQVHGGCPSIVPDAIRTLRNAKQVNHMLFVGTPEAMGNSFLYALAQAREGVNSQEAHSVQFLDLNACTNDSDRSEQIEECFEKFSGNNKSPLLLIIDGIELLGKTETIDNKQTTPQALATLLQNLVDNSNVRLIAHTTKPDLVAEQIMRLTRDNQIRLSSRFKTTIANAEKEQFVKFFLPKASAEQIRDLIQANGNKTIKEFVSALNRTRILQKSNNQSVDFELSQTQKDAAHKRAQEALMHDSFNTHTNHGERIAKITPGLIKLHKDQNRLQELTDQINKYTNLLETDYFDSVLDKRDKAAQQKDFRDTLQKLQREKEQLEKELAQIQKVKKQLAAQVQPQANAQRPRFAADDLSKQQAGNPLKLLTKRQRDHLDALDLGLKNMLNAEPDKKKREELERSMSQIKAKKLEEYERANGIIRRVRNIARNGGAPLNAERAPATSSSSTSLSSSVVSSSSLASLSSSSSTSTTSEKTDPIKH